MTVGDLSIYETGSGNKVVIVIYGMARSLARLDRHGLIALARARNVVSIDTDIFGLHPNTYQFCDRLAAAGLRVLLPDFFRGKPYVRRSISWPMCG